MWIENGGCKTDYLFEKIGSRRRKKGVLYYTLSLMSLGEL